MDLKDQEEIMLQNVNIADEHETQDKEMIPVPEISASIEENSKDIINNAKDFEWKCDHYLCQKTVVVTNVPIAITKSDLWNHFVKFGKIRYLRMLYSYDSEEQENLRAEIEYHDSHTVLRVLKAPKVKHLYLGRFINPSTYCCQKLNVCKKVKSTKQNRENEDELASQCHFNILADETINYILSFLPFHERIRADRVCKRWQHVNSTCIDLHALNLKDRFTKLGSITLNKANLTSILGKCGKRLRKLNFSSCKHKLPRGFPIEISKRCPNLESVHLCHTAVKVTAIKKLVEECKYLETVELKACNGLDDRSVKFVLDAGQNIKYLDLSDNPKLTGKYFHLVKDKLETLILNGCKGLSPAGLLHLQNSHIRDLRLKNCPALTSESIITVIKALKPSLTKLHLAGSFRNCKRESFPHFLEHCENLQELNLEKNTYVSTFTICDISRTCHQLRYLNLSANSLSDDAIRRLRHLPCLQYLFLNYMKSISDDGLIDLSQGGQLEHVELRGCYLVGNIGCAALLKNCNKLKLLALVTVDTSRTPWSSKLVPWNA